MSSAISFVDLLPGVMATCITNMARNGLNTANLEPGSRIDLEDIDACFDADETEREYLQALEAARQTHQAAHSNASDWH